MRTEQAFKVKVKAFFLFFKGLLIAKNCLRPESVPLKNLQNSQGGVVFKFFKTCFEDFCDIC